MSWLTNFVKPKLRELVSGSRDIPENLWHKCPNCGEMIFHRELEKALKVCQHCGHHMRLNGPERLKMLFDNGEFQRAESDAIVEDPLKFSDQKKYAARLKDARAKTEDQDALIVAHGEIGGMPAVVAALNFDFMGGSMGMGVGEAFVRAARLAVVQDAPFIVVPSSGGARMQEGILSLMQMARTTIAVEEVREAGLPYIVLLTDPTTGGVSASFAMLGDIQISEPGAVIGFAGARVIEQTIREKLPEGFQRAEYLLEHGMVDMVVHRHQLKERLVSLIGLLRNPGPAGDLVPLDRDEAEEETEQAEDDQGPVLPDGPDEGPNEGADDSTTPDEKSKDEGQKTE
ncbi:MAG: acetyl-CoA carboxylase, carboxyltransferase subunit beta [Magnetovibrionaceae bacterium]